MKISETCSCGAKVELTDDSIYTSAVERLVKKWRTIHAPHIFPTATSPGTVWWETTGENGGWQEQPPQPEYGSVLTCVCDTRCGSYVEDCPVHGNAP